MPESSENVVPLHPEPPKPPPGTVQVTLSEAVTRAIHAAVQIQFQVSTHVIELCSTPAKGRRSAVRPADLVKYAEAMANATQTLVNCDAYLCLLEQRASKAAAAQGTPSPEGAVEP